MQAGLQHQQHDSATERQRSARARVAAARRDPTLADFLACTFPGEYVLRRIRQPHRDPQGRIRKLGRTKLHNETVDAFLDEHPVLRKLTEYFLTSLRWHIPTTMCEGRYAQELPGGARRLGGAVVGWYGTREEYAAIAGIGERTWDRHIAAAESVGWYERRYTTRRDRHRFPGGFVSVRSGGKPIKNPEGRYMLLPGPAMIAALRLEGRFPAAGPPPPPPGRRCNAMQRCATAPPPPPLPPLVYTPPSPTVEPVSLGSPTWRSKAFSGSGDIHHQIRVSAGPLAELARAVDNSEQALALMAALHKLLPRPGRRRRLRRPSERPPRGRTSSPAARTRQRRTRGADGAAPTAGDSPPAARKRRLATRGGPPPAAPQRDGCDATAPPSEADELARAARAALLRGNHRLCDAILRELDEGAP